jgi:hypothetical protein
MRIVLIVLAALAASGCAVGNMHNYTMEPSLTAQGALTVAVATQDARPYVVNREKTANFVGLQRGGFGNPFDVTTESGRPLADDFSAAVTAALSRRGFKATAVSVAPSAALPDVRALAAGARAERVALLSLHEWKADTYTNVALHHEVVLRVFDAAGTLLAQARVAGNDNLGGSVWNPPEHAKGAVPAAYRKKLEELFSNEAVVRSLR